MLVVPLADHDGDSLPVLRPQLLLYPLRVGGDEARCRVEDGLRRAVVLLQRNNLGLRVVGLEAQDVADVCVTPGVYGLVRVADDTQIAMGLRQLLRDRVLHDVGVLELVDHEVDVPVPVLLSDLREPIEQKIDLEQKVIEVGRRALGQELLVPLVDAEHHLVEVALARQSEPVHVQQLALGGRDRGKDGPRRKALGVDLHLLHAALYQGDLVRVVVDGVVAVQPDGLSFATKHRRAKGVERPGGEVSDVRAQQLRQPMPHLPGRPVGEGDRGDPVWRHAAYANQVGDAVGYDAGLPAARTGDNQQRPVNRLDGLALLGVQPCQNLVDHTVTSTRL